jgi:hypothetical protein
MQEKELSLNCQVPRQVCCSDDLIMFTPSPKMAEFDLAEEPVEVE